MLARLADLARDLSLPGRRVGYEARETFEPSSYAAMHLYGAGIVELLERTKQLAAKGGVPYQALIKRLVDAGVSRLERRPKREH